jgi:hypothetical protein
MAIMIPTFIQRYQAELELFKKMVLDEFGIELNMNDTFGYAFSDSEPISSYDLEKLFPLYLKYGRDIFVAYVSLKRGYYPLLEVMNERFEEMLEDIMKIKNNNKLFFED